MTRIKHAYNVLSGKSYSGYSYSGGGSSSRPDRIRLGGAMQRTIIPAMYNRIAIDCSAVSIVHARVNAEGKYLETIDSGINNCLSIRANADQPARAFRQDIYMSLFDEGVVAIVPSETTQSISNSNRWDVTKLRTGKVLEWFPSEVLVRVYDEYTGQKKDLKFPKELISIVENPLYSVMNEPNGTLQSLTRKLNQLDVINDQSGMGKLDLVFQLPYVVKTKSRREEAERRRMELEQQLSDAKLGVAWVDASEKIVQLNRSVENNIMEQVEYLTSMLYSQLGLTEGVFNGTASEAELVNYHNRTIEPVVQSVCEALTATQLTKTARSQGQRFLSFQSPFKFVTATTLAELTDKLTRNEILSSNEVRAEIGYKPSSDKKADELINKNLNISNAVTGAEVDNPRGETNETI